MKILYTFIYIILLTLISIDLYYFFSDQKDRMESSEDECDPERPPISSSLSPAPTHSSSHSSHSPRPISTTPMTSSPSAIISSTTSSPPSAKSKISFSIESCILGNNNSRTSSCDTPSSTTAQSPIISHPSYIPQSSPTAMFVTSSGFPQSIQDLGPSRNLANLKHKRFHPWMNFPPYRP